MSRTMRQALIVAVVLCAAAYGLFQAGAHWGFRAALLHSRYLPSIMAVLFLGAMWLTLGRSWRVRERLLGGLTVHTISRSLRGLVMVSGRVASANELTDPLTGTACAGYVLRIDRRILSTRYRDWDKVAQVTTVGAEGLLLDDGHGRARMTEFMTMDRLPTAVSPVWRVPDIPEHSRALTGDLVRRGIFGTGEEGRTTVWVFRQGDAVTLVGTARPQPAGTAADVTLQVGDDRLQGCTTRTPRQLAGDYRTKGLAGVYGGGTLVLLALGALLYTLGFAN